jgi:hypothetical protein
MFNNIDEAKDAIDGLADRLALQARSIAESKSGELDQ